MQKRAISLLPTILLFCLNACGITYSPEIGPASATPKPAPAQSNSKNPAPPPAASATYTSTPLPRIVSLDSAAIRSEIDALGENFIADERNAGLSVALILRDPQTGQLGTLLLNFGISSKDFKAAVTSDTIYEIGSLTKVFTGILLAEAVQQGRMRLQDPIQTYLPQGAKAPVYLGSAITLIELATHRSSLPRDLSSDNMTDLYRWLSRYRIDHAPGSAYQYSNVGFELLGDLLAKNYGQDFGTLDFQSVSQPLGMPDTREVLSGDQQKRLAQGYDSYGSPAPFFPSSGAKSSAGSLHSNLADMARFLIANMQPDSTPLAASIRLAQRVLAEGNDPGSGAGLGWNIDHPNTSYERIWKDGGTFGFTSYISLAEDGSSGFVLLSNGKLVNDLVPDMLRITGE